MAGNLAIGARQFVFSKPCLLSGLLAEEFLSKVDVGLSSHSASCFILILGYTTCLLTHVHVSWELEELNIQSQE